MSNYCETGRCVCTCSESEIESSDLFSWTDDDEPEPSCDGSGSMNCIGGMHTPAVCTEGRCVCGACTLNYDEVDDDETSGPARKKAKIGGKELEGNLPATFATPTGMVNFLVGPTEKSFLVPLALACSTSPVFAAALTNPHFTEAQTLTYRLDDVSPAIFRMAVQWMHRDKLDLMQIPPSSRSSYYCYTSGYAAAARAEDEALIELWVLGDRLPMYRLQNEVQWCIDAIGHVDNMRPLYGLQYLVENTTAKSQLRRYVVETLVLCGNGTKLRRMNEVQEIPSELMFEITMRAMNRRMWEMLSPLSDYYVGEIPEAGGELG